MRTRFSLSGRFALFAGTAMLAAAAAAAWASALGWPPVSVFLAGLAVGVPLAAWMVARAFRPVRNTLRTLTDGVRSFHENDFGLRIAGGQGDELGELVSLYNRLGDALRRERNEIYQRELLLDTVLQGAPMAIVLVNELQRVVYANAAARGLLGRSRRLAGRALAELLEGCPPEIRRPLAAEEDAIVTGAQALSDADGDGETFRVINRRFHLNTQEHRLIVVERMTAELKRQEVDVWKKVIRVMSHELNNSLAPVRSLVHSARLLAGRPDRERVVDVLGSVEDRVKHLCDFLEGYARFARLPLPRRETVSWRSFLATVQAFFPFRLETPIGPEEGYFDPAQMQQVLINLLKNAVESGSPPAEIAVALERSREGSWLVHVLDRGREMDEETMKKALLPFYSSKQSGTGLGLPLCTEILTAHGGTLRLQRRPGGGMAVTCVLPASNSAA